jgi:hypothetical protein
MNEKIVKIPIDEYKELLEDIQDLLIIIERIDEPTISFDEVKDRLRKEKVI